MVILESNEDRVRIQFNMFNYGYQHGITTNLIKTYHFTGNIRRSQEYEMALDLGKTWKTSKKIDILGIPLFFGQSSRDTEGLSQENIGTF